jgi:hypothetical protein
MSQQRRNENAETDRQNNPQRETRTQHEKERVVDYYRRKLEKEGDRTSGMSWSNWSGARWGGRS